MSVVRVHNFSISLDGFGTGEGQDAHAYFGHAGERLHEWMFATQGGSPAAAPASTTPSCGNTIPESVPKSWVPASSAIPDGTRIRSGRAPGDQSAVSHTGLRPHPPHPLADRDGGRHHLPLHRRVPRPRQSSRPKRPLTAATYAWAAAPTVIRDFLAAGLVDHLHVVVVPILLGRGRPAVGQQARGTGAGLPRRGHLRTQRRHPPHLHQSARVTTAHDPCR